MRTVLAVIAVILIAVLGIAVFPPSTDEPEAAKVATIPATTNPVEIPFMQGGTVALHLEAGDYKVTASPDDRIIITPGPMHIAAVGTVRVSTGKNGSNANVRVETPSGNSIHVDIAVPRQTNLYARLTAGNLNIEGVEGSKDAEIRAGNLTMDVGDPDNYKTVHLAVTSGNVQASPWSVQKPGLMRSFSTTGKGRYGLHARVSAGNIVLNSFSATK